MGRSVLAYQFVAGLLPEIKLKLAGTDGSMDELLVKARFREAKLRDLAPKVGDEKPFVLASQQTGATTTRERSRTPPSTTESQARNRMKCFHCQGTGHFTRNCPMRGRAAPRESRGWNQGAARQDTGPKRVATIAVDSGSTPADRKRQKQDRVAELRRQLQEAEVEDSMTEVVATMYVLHTGEENHTFLGPTLTVQVKFEWSPVRALLDTGLPVTIVSMEFLLWTLAKRRPVGQTTEEWETAVRTRLETPSVTLQSYGGKELNIIRQITARVARGDRQCGSTILVQKHAPLDLLLGTDLQSKLGFFFMEASGEETVTDVLQQQTWKLSPTTSEDDSIEPRLLFQSESTIEESTRTTVRLISATRLPARHCKHVRARVDDFEDDRVAMFESLLKDKGVLIETAATQPDIDNCITLTVENHGLEPVCLNGGCVLGSLQPVTILQDAEVEPEKIPTAQGVVRAFPKVKNSKRSPTSQEAPVQTKTKQTAEREETLGHALELETTPLPQEESRQLKELVLEYANVFALDPSELGTTNMVRHMIDTEDSHPVRQLPRRVPFAPCGRVEEIVDDMLQRGFVVPSRSPRASPIVLVAKKDGTIRFCIDYRRLNAVTKMDVFPLPRIDDSLALLSDCKYFTTLDLATGY